MPPSAPADGGRVRFALGSGVTWTCALSTLALFVVAITLALHVRLGLGHWPTPMSENYRTTAYDIHEGLLIGIAFFASYAAGPLWGLCVCLRRLRLRARTHVIQAGLYLGGWGLLAGFIALDPYRFVSWFAD